MATTDTETVESILRELAERHVMIQAGRDGIIRSPDPRFKALRGEHEWYFRARFSQTRRCAVCGDHEEAPGPYCLRTDLGSIVRAAAACGHAIATWQVGDSFVAAVMDWEPSDWPHELDDAPNVMKERYEGDTTELAAARALKAAVQEA